MLFETNLYFVTWHVAGLKWQFGRFHWVEGLSGGPAGPVMAAVWKGEAEAKTGL